jgi:hypothetical protein
MNNLPQTPPAPKFDTKTQHMINDAIAGIKFHSHNNCKTTWDQAQVEKELNLFYKQLEALDSPSAEHLRIDEKKTLRDYYKKKIRQNLQRLAVFMQGSADIARAINCNVVEPQILS